MRATKALALVALSAITLIAPLQGVNADNLNREVSRILNKSRLYPSRIIAPSVRPIAISQPAVIASGACGTPVAVDACGTPLAIAAPATVVVRQNILEDRNGTPLILSQPVVIAPAVGGVALLTPGPSDLDARRDALEKRILEASALGQISEATKCELQSAMCQVKQAEVSWLSAGALNPEMSRRLYRSMDKVDSDLHYFTNRSSINLLGLRLTPTGYL